MTKFLNADFLLENETARKLYHGHAAGLGIYDFHNHLSPKVVAENKNFRNLSEAWLESDHYKWRAMRSNGVPESLITGAVDPFARFGPWASTVPATIGNPLFVWTHLELSRYFGIDELLNLKSAINIWNEANELLQQDDFRPQQMLKRMNVELIGTTDDPADPLDHHEHFAAQNAGFRMVPTFRPDQCFAFNGPLPWNKWREKLGKITGKNVETLNELFGALRSRAQDFHAAGCRMADHGLTNVPTKYIDHGSAERAFGHLLNENEPHTDELESMRVVLLDELAGIYHDLNWTAQFHIGALRNPNAGAFEKLGPDSGFDTIGDSVPISSLATTLGRWTKAKKLPSIILYNLNPADNWAFASLCGSFHRDGHPGTVRHGASWWFLDQRNGIDDQLEAWSSLNLLRNFPGMITDSRSFLSFPRHEFFRRVLCNWMGREVERGLIPDDEEVLSQLLHATCRDNARSMFI